MESLNQQKIDKIQAWTSQGPSLCSSMSQDRPRVLQDAKVEAPSLPNDTHGHHKPEIWSQTCQESSNQEPASQHTFQQSQGGRRQGRSLKINKYFQNCSHDVSYNFKSILVYLIPWNYCYLIPWNYY